jgi:hypothetical protein
MQNTNGSLKNIPMVYGTQGQVSQACSFVHSDSNADRKSACTLYREKKSRSMLCWP